MKKQTTKIIKGDLVLKKNTTFNTSIKVEGNIRCEGERFNLKVAGDINARDIVARNIFAGNINAGNINAWNIVAGDIVAGDIICDKRIKKSSEAKTICRVFVQNKFSLNREERMK